MQGSFEWIMDEELVCTLSDWLMMFENCRSFFRLRLWWTRFYFHSFLWNFHLNFLSLRATKRNSHNPTKSTTNPCIFQTVNKYFPVIDPKLHDDNGKNTSTPVALCDYYKVDQSIYLYIHINELALHLSLHHSTSYPDPFWMKAE